MARVMGSFPILTRLPCLQVRYCLLTPALHDLVKLNNLTNDYRLPHPANPLPPRLPPILPAIGVAYPTAQAPTKRLNLGS